MNLTTVSPEEPNSCSCLASLADCRGAAAGKAALGAAVAMAAGTTADGTNLWSSSWGRTAGRGTGADGTKDDCRAAAAGRKGVKLTNGAGRAVGGLASRTGAVAATVGMGTLATVGKGAARTGGAAVGRAARPTTGRSAVPALGRSTRTFFTSFLVGATAAGRAAGAVKAAPTAAALEAGALVLTLGTILTKPDCLRVSVTWKPVSSAL